MREEYNGISIAHIKQFALDNMNYQNSAQITVDAKNNVALSNPWIDESARFDLSDEEATETWGEEAINRFCEAASKHLLEKEEFEQECYYAYQLDWMISHGWSLSDLYSVLVGFASEQVEEDAMNMPTTANDIEKLADEAREHFLYEEGFCGSLYVCKEEFLTHEFLDTSYMAHLFRNMYKGGVRRRFYEKYYRLINIG